MTMDFFYLQLKSVSHNNSFKELFAPASKF